MLSNRLELREMTGMQIPEWIDQEAWSGFVEMRKSIKRPLTTQRAMSRLIHRLTEFKTKGHDPNACLDQSTFHNWQDVYPVKTDPIPNLVPERYEAPKMTDEEWKRSEEARKTVMQLVHGAIKRVA